jgi:outer membrane protein assembly factor BamD (BamD/ComL family)
MRFERFVSAAGIAFCLFMTLFCAPTQEKSRPQISPRNSVSADELYQQGLSFFQEDKLSQAADTFKKCLQLKPGHAYAHYHLGLVYYELKRKDLTIVHLEKFLKLAPSAPEADQVRKILNAIR